MVLGGRTYLIGFGFFFLARSLGGYLRAAILAVEWLVWEEGWLSLFIWLFSKPCRLILLGGIFYFKSFFFLLFGWYFFYFKPRSGDLP